MAGLRGNNAWLMLAKQSAKGTAATPAVATTHKLPFSGGNIGPVRETDNLSETDASRDQGVPYVTTTGVEGSPEVYVRDASIGAILTWSARRGRRHRHDAELHHAITPSNTLPYFTFWRNLSDTLWERYQDCQIGSATISGEAGGSAHGRNRRQGLSRRA
jgi:hypothetical protein